MQDTTTEAAAISDLAKPRDKKQSQFPEIWRRFRTNPLAVAGLAVILLMILIAIFADVLAPGTALDPGYDIQDLSRTRQLPSSEHIFGTDHLGRDLFARIVHGSRITLTVGLIVVSISLTVGVTLGSIASFYGGVVDIVIMRVVDIILAIPSILLAIAIAAALGGGLPSIMVAVGVSAIPSYARIVRGQVLSVKGQEFVEAARSLGASNLRIILRHVLPNCMAPVIVSATMGIATAILSAAALSFLGLGLQPPTPEWGAMLSDGRRFMLNLNSWHMTLFPGLFIAAIVFSLNLVGDGLRDALDPKLRSAGFSKRKFNRMKRNLENRLKAAEISE